MAINYGKPLPMLPKREGKQNGRTPKTSEELFGSKPVLDVVMAGNALLSRASGRPHSGKQVVSLRLDPDVIEKFRATGPGWQARINEILRKA